MPSAVVILAKLRGWPEVNGREVYGNEDRRVNVSAGILTKTLRARHMGMTTASRVASRLKSMSGQLRLDSARGTVRWKEEDDATRGMAAQRIGGVVYRAKWIRKDDAVPDARTGAAINGVSRGGAGCR